jgi:hypothetical protein
VSHASNCRRRAKQSIRPSHASLAQQLRVDLDALAFAHVLRQLVAVCFGQGEHGAAGVVVSDHAEELLDAGGVAVAQLGFDHGADAQHVGDAQGAALAEGELDHWFWRGRTDGSVPQADEVGLEFSVRVCGFVDRPGHLRNLNFIVDSGASLSWPP